MKTITVRTLCALLAMFAGLYLFGQDKDSKTESQKYRLYLVRDENGNKEIIDKTFSTKEEMDAYIKANKIESPESEMAPPSPPPPPAVPGAPADKKKDKKMDNKERKIIIIEKDEGGVDGKTDFSIDLSQLNPEETSKLIQEVINLNIAKVQVVHINKQDVKSSSAPEINMNDEKDGERVGINNISPPPSAHLSNFKVYPNPGKQFHVQCDVNTPSDIKLRILDMQGKEVFHESTLNFAGRFEKNINGALLSTGTYLMDVEACGERATTMVVRQ